MPRILAGMVVALAAAGCSGSDDETALAEVTACEKLDELDDIGEITEATEGDFGETLAELIPAAVDADDVPMAAAGERLRVAVGDYDRDGAALALLAVGDRCTELGLP